MRLSKMLFVTLRETPAEAEIPSHQLLLRAGYIRRIGSGIYAYLPLMWRVLKKVSNIVREEMDETGAQECLLPQLQPAQLWQESGRWNTYTKAEGIARETIVSYRQLPLNLYQIQTKFRDEIRPRFGLMRGREFIMKDAYSFHTDEASLKQTYQDMDRAYRQILTRCGLQFRAVEADSGAIGGSGSQEFMILAEAGEDEILYTEDGKYAANVEKAVSLSADVVDSPFKSYEKLATPDTETIALLAEAVKCSPTAIVKNVLYEVVYDNGNIALALVSIRGDRDVNEVKLFNELTKLAPQYNAKTIIALSVPDLTAQKKWAAKVLPLGYIAPDIADDYISTSKMVAPQFIRLADKTVVELTNFVTGANEVGYHVVGANWGEQFTLPKLVVDIQAARVGDRAIHDSSQTLNSARGIEAGHIFQLGTKYSDAMGATFTDEGGKNQPLWMGCYGIGVSRLAQAAVEQSHDRDGIIWPVSIAPYQVIVIIPNITETDKVNVAEQLYHDLNQAGIETLLDDRQERAGVKFKDSELIGIPYRIVTGRSLAGGRVEVVKRATKESRDIAIAEVVATIKGWIEGELSKS
jgi:prolyl-tRNA synthetase